MKFYLQNPDYLFIDAAQDFEALALRMFQYQYKQLPIYRAYCDGIGVDINQVKFLHQIPFLPISFFKTHVILSKNTKAEKIFESSGSSGLNTSKHHVADLNWYHISLLKHFEAFWGKPSEYCILGLLPGYLERSNASLVYMVRQLMRASGHKDNGFYLHDFGKLNQKLRELETQKQKCLLIGVSYALVDFAAQYPQQLKHTLVMETGGMKGKRKELIKSALHQVLLKAFGLSAIASEYGMTELLSQAYSKAAGIFTPAISIRVLVRDLNDPMEVKKSGSGALNIIDLANIHSCSFIATDDLGKVSEDGQFEILGRIDHSDLRGCNLLLD